MISEQQNNFNFTYSTGPCHLNQGINFSENGDYKIMDQEHSLFDQADFSRKQSFNIQKMEPSFSLECQNNFNYSDFNFFEDDNRAQSNNFQCLEEQELTWGENNQYHPIQDQAVQDAFNNNIEFQEFEIEMDTDEQKTMKAQNLYSVNKNAGKRQKVKVAKDYNKNICRYITRQAIRCLVSREYTTIVKNRFCQKSQDLYEGMTEFFLGQIEFISGIRALKEFLIVNGDDSKELRTYKKVFKNFLRWYLKERAVRYILRGNMKDKAAFIEYKNKVMLHYLERPNEWHGNKVSRKEVADCQNYLDDVAN